MEFEKNSVLPSYKTTDLTPDDGENRKKEYVEEMIRVHGDGNKAELDDKTRVYADDKKDGPEDVKNYEVEKFDPLEIDGVAVNREFVNYNEHLGSEVTSFVSKDARNKYKALKDVKNEQTLELQRAGYAIPLLKTDQCWKAIFSHTLMKIYRFVPPPSSEDRLFDPKADRYEYCLVRKWHTSSYTRFELKFTPNPTDRSEDFTLYMIYHRRNPIVDISSYKGRRYRWITPLVWKWKCEWAYDLHELSAGQDSLTDNLREDGKVSKENPLLGNAWKNNLMPQIKDTSSFQGKQIGIADYREKFSKVPPVRFGYQEKTLGDNQNLESINSVSEESLVFLCLVSILKNHEDLRSLGLEC